MGHIGRLPAQLVIFVIQMFEENISLSGRYGFLEGRFSYNRPLSKDFVLFLCFSFCLQYFWLHLQ